MLVLRRTPELWSRKPGTTGFTAQLVSLLDGSAVYISDPLPGKTHDAKAFTETPVAKIVEHSGGGIGDKGYQGCPGMITPRKKPPGGELSKTDNKSNADISVLRAPVERLVAHFKSWRIFHTDYRRPYATYQQSFIMSPADCSSSQSSGVLNNVQNAQMQRRMASSVLHDATICLSGR